MRNALPVRKTAEANFTRQTRAGRSLHRGT
jgi:hypothetical protein